MFAPLFTPLLIPLLVAIFLATNMGASGTSPAFAPAYGADLVRREVIPGLFGLFVFLGAIVAGRKVALTVGRDILPPESLGLSITTVVLLAIGLSLLLANVLRVPQSTSQSTIFALVGCGAYLGIVETHRLLIEIIPTWFITPIAAFLVTLAVGKTTFEPMKRRGWIGPTEAGRIRWLRMPVLGACCYVAFAIGSNNVANASGPIASMVFNELGLETTGARTTLVLLLAMFVVAPFFGIGSSLMGRRVAYTTGKEIVEFGPRGATLVAFVTATLLLLVSITRGIPTSLVQMNTAAIIGLGVTKYGAREVLRRTAVLRLATVWIVAPLVAMGLAFGFTWALDVSGLLAY